MNERDVVMTEWDKKEFNKRIDETLYEAVCILDWLSQKYPKDSPAQIVYETYCEGLYSIGTMGLDWAEVSEEMKNGRSSE